MTPEVFAEVDRRFLETGHVFDGTGWVYAPVRAKRVLAIREFRDKPIPTTIAELHASLVDLLIGLTP